MKIPLLLTFLFLTLNTLAQEKDEAQIFTAALQQGEQFVLGERSIKFKEVISDSRCPKDVTCIWAGEAKVLIEIFGNGNFIEEKIISVGSSSIPFNFSSQEGLQYSLHSLTLLPYPTTQSKNPDLNYTLSLKITGQN